MFSTTHDAVLLVIAVLYVLTFFGRVILANGPSYAGRRIPTGWFAIPAMIATLCALVAVLW